VTLREKQSAFVSCLGELIAFAENKGWELTLGEGFVSSKTGHMRDSLHYIKLAQDLNLFVLGKWKDRDCPEWQAMGAFWKTLYPLAKWGGDFDSVDLNHFSLGHGGRA
jgi:hypothetical protein